MKRLDLAIVEQGLAPTRSKAQQMIAAGEIEILKAGQWRAATQASELAGPGQIRCTSDSQILKYVSRGGLKLEAALDHLKLDVNGWRCLDIGISTGGFADCLLQQGAASICGIDVGHGQLHPSLKADPRVSSFEGVHIKDLAQQSQVQAWLRSGVNLAVADLSFISLISVLPAIHSALPSETPILALIKPQFEVGAEHLDKKGIVRDQKLFDQVETRVLNAFSQLGRSVSDYFACSVKGQDGNQEFFAYSDRRD